MRQFILCILAVVASTASAVAAQPNERNASRERRIEESLGAISTSAVPTFRRATEAMDSGKYAEAEAAASANPVFNGSREENRGGDLASDHRGRYASWSVRPFSTG